MISDVLVFNKIKEKLGGRVRIMVTGGAPIPAHVEEFLKVSMCAPVVQVRPACAHTHTHTHIPCAHLWYR